MNIRLESLAFEEGYPLPPQYSCDRLNLSPPLSWYGVPANAKSLAVVMEDAHATEKRTLWIIYNLPAHVISLPEGVPSDEFTETGAMQARNDFGSTGYFGPCTSRDPRHYLFRIYALDRMLRLPRNAGRAEFDAAIEDNILGNGILSCTYGQVRHTPRQSPEPRWSRQNA